MPGAKAKRGDIYNVHPSAASPGDAHQTPRPMLCVAEQPNDQLAWRAMSRTTTAGTSVDLFSAADASLGLTKDGWWSYRYLRSVKKRWTGDPSLCAYKSTLTNPLLSTVMAHYMSRK